MTFADLHQQTEASVSGKPSLVVAGKFIRVTHTGLKHIDSTIWTERQHLDKYKLYMGKFVSIATGCKFFLSGNFPFFTSLVYFFTAFSIILLRVAYFFTNFG